MTKRLFFRLAALLLLLAIAAGWYWRTKTAKPTVPAEAVAIQPTSLEFLPQEVFVVAPLDLKQTLRLSGSLRSIDLASVKARVAGEVREVLVREGETVRAGQVLVKMDVTEYDARVAQARANLNSARAQLDIANKARDNNQALLDKGFISKNGFDNSASQSVAARANVDAAQAALELTQKLLVDTVLRAPIAGIVSARNVQPGEKVSPDFKLLDLVNLQKLELEAAVPASDIAQIAIGQSVEVNVEGLTQSFTGKVVRINPMAQASSRAVAVYIQVPNPDSHLKVGMFAEALLTLNQRRGILAVPTTALRKEGGANFVYAIEDGKIARKPVGIGAEGLSGNQMYTEILSGLSFGAEMIASNMGSLKTGTAARVAPAASKE